MPDFEKSLLGLKTDLKNYTDRVEGRMTTLQTQVDAIDLKLADRHVSLGCTGSVEKKLRENEGLSRLLRDRKGTAFIKFEGPEVAELERKTIISSTAAGAGLAPVGTATTGVLTIERIPGIVPEARQMLRVRDLLFARPTTAALVDFVKVLTPMAIASPVPEASQKPENAVTFQPVSEKVKTIATWIPATRQVLDDFPELNGFINSTLPYYVNLEEENQLLSGSNTGEDLHGLLLQAQPFDAALLSPTAGWTRLDQIGRAIEQITSSKEIEPTFVILHPNDWWSIRLTKDGFGRYILGDPQTPVVRPQIFGLDLVSTTSISIGSFLVGSGNPTAAEIRDRMEMQVEISTEHADFFTKNLVAIRAEKRLALVVKRPNSYVTGSFATSPAS